MASIFISHSQDDTNKLSFFNRVFSATNLKAVIQEYEKLFTNQKVSNQTILRNINACSALFVLLSPNVQRKDHTRDWVVAESAKCSKDVWIFEDINDMGKVSIVIPFFKHYVIYGENEVWLNYLNKIVDSYDPIHFLKGAAFLGLIALTGGVGLGAAGALLGGIASSSSNSSPTGIKFTCGNCSSSYFIHIPQGLAYFRCPVCNTTNSLNWS